MACEPRFADIFVGNPYIFRRLDYMSAMEQEMLMTGSGHNDPYFHVFLHPGIPTQRHLGYLSSTAAAMTTHLNLT